MRGSACFFPTRDSTAIKAILQVVVVFSVIAWSISSFVDSLFIASQYQVGIPSDEELNKKDHPLVPPRDTSYTKEY